MNSVSDRFVTQNECFAGDENFLWAKTRLNTSEGEAVLECKLENNKGWIYPSQIRLGLDF